MKKVMKVADSKIAGLEVVVALEMVQHLSVVFLNLVRHQEWLSNVLIRQLNHSALNFKHFHMIITRRTH